MGYLILFQVNNKDNYRRQMCWTDAFIVNFELITKSMV